jgi:hypothetical protein
VIQTDGIHIANGLVLLAAVGIDGGGVKHPAHADPTLSGAQGAQHHRAPADASACVGAANAGTGVAAREATV